MTNKTKAKKTGKKIQLKTKQNSNSVSTYLNSIEPLAARKDGKALAKLFKAITGAKPRMWGGSIVGYGKYIYYRANGDEGELCATGFSMRKSGPVLYIMPGYTDYSAIMKKLGPHKLGKSCLYLKSLEGVDLDVISELISTAIKDLRKGYEVAL